MKIALLFLALGVATLFGVNVVQNNVIHEQQNLIHQMTKNPACMIPASPKITDN